MLQNAPSLAKSGADTAENGRHFAENLPTIGNCHLKIVANEDARPVGRARGAGGREVQQLQELEGLHDLPACLRVELYR